MHLLFWFPARVPCNNLLSLGIAAYLLISVFVTFHMFVLVSLVPYIKLVDHAFSSLYCVTKGGLFESHIKLFLVLVSAGMCAIW